MTIKLYRADCLDALKTMEDNSIDSMVTDPPAGISILGHKWDENRGGRSNWVDWLTNIMREAFRIMKPGAHGLVWSIPRTSHWTSWALEDAGFEVRDVLVNIFGSGMPKSKSISKQFIKNNPELDPELIEAQLGHLATVLKPAAEHWILVRKPLSEATVSENIQKWSTGALNIKDSRIKTSTDDNLGRWPANVILSHSEECKETCALSCPVFMIDQQSGIKRSRKANISDGRRVRSDQVTVAVGGLGSRGPENSYGDAGGASRFFYQNKPTTAERTLGGAVPNEHPTVKSLALMRFLVRLVTPQKKMVVADFFMGSGSTAIACIEESFDFIGVEKDKEYFELAKARIHAFQNMKGNVL